MSSFALLMMIASGALAYIFIRTLQKEGMKIASDPEQEGNVQKAEANAVEDQFTQAVARADKAFEEGALHDAEAALETALRIQPENEEVLGKLAFILEQQGDAKAAAAIYEKALELHPHAYRLYSSYAGLKEENGDKVGAKELYIKAVQLEPYDATIYYRFANLLAELGETEAARQGYEKALDIDKKFQPAIDALKAL